MASITLGRTTPGALSDANADLNNNWTLLENLLNGALDTANLAPDSVGNSELAPNAVTNTEVAAAAAIAYSKLNLSNSIDSGDIAPGAVGDVNFMADSPVVVATTVAGLGTVRQGKMGLLRVGSTPFEFLAVTYDATLAKWVSAPVAHITAQQSTYATSDAAYTLASPDNVSRALVRNAKALYDAGMRPQVASAARMANNGANSTFTRAAIYELADGDTAATSLGAAAEVVHVGTTATWKVSTGWEAVAVTPVDAHWQLVVEHKENAGTGTFTDVQAQMRWVSV